MVREQAPQRPIQPTRQPRHMQQRVRLDLFEHRGQQLEEHEYALRVAGQPAVFDHDAEEVSRPLERVSRAARHQQGRQLQHVPDLRRLDEFRCPIWCIRDDRLAARERLEPTRIVPAALKTGHHDLIHECDGGKSPVSANGQCDSAEWLDRSSHERRYTSVPTSRTHVLESVQRATCRLIWRWMAANNSPRTIGFFSNPMTSDMSPAVSCTS